MTKCRAADCWQYVVIVALTSVKVALVSCSDVCPPVILSPPPHVTNVCHSTSGPRHPDDIPRGGNKYEWYMRHQTTPLFPGCKYNLIQVCHYIICQSIQSCAMKEEVTDCK